jgi:hypothetical protein
MVKKSYTAVLILAFASGLGASAAFAGATLDVKDAWYGVKDSAECHRFKNRVVRCTDDASCNFACDSTSACGDPAPGKPKICNITYTCSDKPAEKKEKTFPEATTPHVLACN